MGKVEVVSVRLQVTGPAGAMVRVDQRELGVVPVDVELPAQPGERRLEVTLKGHDSFVQQVAGGKDVVVQANLPRRAAAAPVRKDKAPPPPPGKRSEVSDPFKQ